MLQSRMKARQILLIFLDSACGSKPIAVSTVDSTADSQPLDRHININIYIYFFHVPAFRVVRCLIKNMHTSSMHSRRAQATRRRNLPRGEWANRDSKKGGQHRLNRVENASSFIEEIEISETCLGLPRRLRGEGVLNPPTTSRWIPGGGKKGNFLQDDDNVDLHARTTTIV